MCIRDRVSSWWCNLLGHSHPKINQAIKNQLDSLEHVIFANFSHKMCIRDRSLAVNGFINDLVQEFPMEYSVELRRLIDLEMEDSIG